MGLVWILIVLSLVCSGASLFQRDPYAGLLVCVLAVALGMTAVAIAFSGKI